MEVLLGIVAALAVLAAVTTAIHAREGRGRAADAADRRAAELEARLRGSEADREVLDLVLSSMTEGVLLFSRVGVVTYANAAAERHLGATPRSAEELLPLPIRGAVERAESERTPVEAEAELGAPARWLRGSAVPVGADRGVLLVLRDVTEARRLEAVRRDFVANASHELKTPAATIRAAAETIRAAAPDDPTAVGRFAAQLEGEAIRLGRIVGDLLDLSRLESGSDRDEPVDVGSVVRAEVARVAERARDGGVALDVRADGVPRVRGSEGDLALLVRNLVENAVGYTGSGGRVDVAAAADGDDVVISVADTGVGIPQRDVPRVFERFFRVDRARSRETGGTGLGLSIVKHVAENHGGTVSVRSEVGRGTTFEVRLPAAR